MKQKKNAKTKTKGDHMSLRIGAHEKHAIEFWSAVNRQSETAFIEAAIEAYALQLAIDPETRAKQAKLLKGADHDHRWREIFHTNRGVRELRKYLLDGFPLDDEQHRRREFVMQHAPFFYEERGDRLVAKVDHIVALWDNDTKLGEFMKLGDSNVTAPGKAMAAVLEARGLEAPAWPPKERRR